MKIPILGTVLSDLKQTTGSSRRSIALAYPDKVRVLLMLFSLFPFFTYSQFNLFRNYSSKDGLPSSEVYCVISDSAGYMWFATDMGVSRFNGYEFKNFTTENGLADNTVFGIYQDRKGRIWFRSAARLSYFENGSFHRPECNPEIEKTLSGTVINSIYVDPGDNIWLGTTGNFYLRIARDWKHGAIKRFNVIKKAGYLLSIEKGFVYGGGNNFIDELTIGDKDLVKSIPLGLQAPYKNPIRYSVIRLKSGAAILSANNMLMLLEGNELRARAIEKSIVTNMAEDHDGNIYVGTYEGVSVYSKNLVYLGNIPELEHKIICSISVDRENELWFCTKGYGIYSIPYRNFNYYTIENGLSASGISCIENIDGKMLIGHLDGSISILDKDSIRQVFQGQEKNRIVESGDVSGILPHKGSIYVGCIRKIYKLDAKDFHLEKVFEGIGTKKIIHSRGDTIWSLSFRKIWKYKLGNDLQKLSYTILNSYTDCIYEDRAGKLWICSSNGLWTLTDKEGLRYMGKKNKLLTTRIAGIQEDAYGRMWMISRGEGVIVKDGNSYFQVKEKDGLASNMCLALFIDSGNVVWVGTNKGLSKITFSDRHENNYRVNSYYAKNGLLNDEVNGIARNGSKIWLAHNNGVSIFDPKKIRDNFTPPPVYITQVLVNDRPLPDMHSELDHSQNYFNISFTGLSYKDPGKVEYKYRMKGIDQDWIYTSYTNVKYPAVPPGSYTFEVYAKNNDGYWSKQPAAISFRVAPAWWQTWWFKITGAVVLLFFGGLLFRQRLNIIKRREHLRTIQRTKIAAAELKALRSQMNPHFMFNAINSVQYFITNNDPRSSEKYLSKFAKLIRYVVDNSKPSSIPLEKELEALRLYLDLESLRFENRFEYTIEIGDNVDTGYVQIPSMLIQPYVENAIWHGLMHKNGPGKITISLAMDDNILKCAVEDNGIGRKRSQELKAGRKNNMHKSVGMSITRERLDIINQINNSNLTVTITDLTDINGSATGTRIDLNIPCY